MSAGIVYPEVGQCPLGAALSFDAVPPLQAPAPPPHGPRGLSHTPAAPGRLSHDSLEAGARVTGTNYAPPPAAASHLLATFAASECPLQLSTCQLLGLQESQEAHSQRGPPGALPCLSLS